jgi:DNA ligase-associated metallophosphoesterase
VPDVSGAAFVPDYGALLVADLHFEKGSSLARRGVHLPPYDTASTIAVLAGAIARHRPARVIALGDSFHDDSADDRLTSRDRDGLARMAEGRDWIWLTGNHDPVLPRGLPGMVADTLSLGPLNLRHHPGGHGPGEIAGHLHPVASISSRGRRLRRRCFIANPERLVMPAFGAFTGGLDVSSEVFSGLFGAGGFGVWMLAGTRIHLFPARSVSRRG